MTQVALTRGGCSARNCFPQVVTCTSAGVTLTAFVSGVLSFLHEWKHYDFGPINTISSPFNYILVIGGLVLFAAHIVAFVMLCSDDHSRGSIEAPQPQSERNAEPSLSQDRLVLHQRGSIQIYKQVNYTPLEHFTHAKAHYHASNAKEALQLKRVAQEIDEHIIARVWVPLCKRLLRQQKQTLSVNTPLLSKGGYFVRQLQNHFIVLEMTQKKIELHFFANAASKGQYTSALKSFKYVELQDAPETPPHIPFELPTSPLSPSDAFLPGGEPSDGSEETVFSGEDD